MTMSPAGKKKPDVRFIALVSAAVVLLVVLGHIARGKPQTVPVQPLPGDEENNIHELVISEIMANNGGTWVNSDNQACDYLELYNGTAEAIDLKGYGLSDRTDTIKWVFSDVTLQPGQYLTVGLTGKLQDGLNAAFRLSAKGGEQVILTNPQARVIDAVDTVALGKDEAMMRDKDGQWFVSSYGTPGYPNNQSGLDGYFASLRSDEEPALAVNELLVRNDGNFRAPDGQYEGFLEVINVSDEPLELSEYAVGLSTAVPFRYTFSARQLAPGEVAVVYAGGKASDSQLGMNFTAKGGVVVLSHLGRIIQEFSYSDLASGFALQRQADGSYRKDPVVSPGWSNDAAGIEAFQTQQLGNPAELIISELMPSNYSYLPQNGDRYYDWLELRNNSGEAVDLSQYVLASNPEGSGGWALPEVTLQPGEYYLVMCSGDPQLSNGSYVHADFKLPAEKSLYLLRDGTGVVDACFYAGVPKGWSYGRGAQDGFFYFSGPTPGSENGSGWRSVSAIPVPSQKPGIYDDVASVNVAFTGEGTIYYTTDGSQPDSGSAVWSGPLVLTATTVVKAVRYTDGRAASPVFTGSYIINEHHTVPVMSVSLDPGDFYTINSHPDTIDLQRQAYAEFYEEDGSFSVPCSLALFGGNTRYFAKRSYALRFSKRWGASELDYPVFDNRDNSVYEALVLRTGSNDWTLAYMRDILGTSLVDDYSDVDVQAYKICVVYINGEYWGLYNLREKVNASFIQEHYNVPGDDLDILRLDGDVTAGDGERYQELRAYCRTHDLSDEENYAYVASQIDITNVIDYWIAESYVANNDTVNVRFFSSPYIEDGKWHWIYYDLDFAWYNVHMDYYTRYLTAPGGMGDGDTYENTIIRSLFESAAFRQQWLERLSYNMANTWKTENVLARIDEIQAVLEPEIGRDHAEWGLSVSEWRDCVDELREYARQRPYYLLRSTKYFFGLSDEQMRQYFGDLWN